MLLKVTLFFVNNCRGVGCPFYFILCEYVYPECLGTAL